MFNPLEYIKDKLTQLKLYVDQYDKEKKVESIKSSGSGKYEIKFKDGKNVNWYIHDIVQRNIKVDGDETEEQGNYQGFTLESYSQDNLALIYADIFHEHMETEVLDEEGANEGDLFKIHFIFPNELIN